MRGDARRCSSLLLQARAHRQKPSPVCSRISGLLTALGELLPLGSDMIFTTAAFVGATLGTASGILTLCGLSLLCKSCKKGKLESAAGTDPEKAKASVLHSLQRFRVEKSTEPIQPKALLNFPKIYKPTPSVTSPEVLNCADLGQTKQTPPKETAKESDACNQATDGPEEVFAIPREVTAAELTNEASRYRVTNADQLQSQGIGQTACGAKSDDSTEGTPSGSELSNGMTTSTSILHPKLHFSLTYSVQHRKLHVTVIEAEHVAVEAGVEGYVAGLLSVEGRERERERQAQTSVRRLLDHVQWGEELIFPLPDGYQVEGEVSLSLHSCDRFSRNTNLGAMRFKLADVGMMSDADCWVDLQPPKQEVAASAGEMLLSISYLPAANRLGVVVMKARGLQSDRLKNNIDLSVKLALKHQSTKLKKKQTRRVKHKINPVWNEMMMLEVPREMLAKSSLDLEVFNQTGQGQLEPLGHCQLGLQASGTGLQHWQQMFDNPRKQIAMWHPLFV
ncbi:synaptotagmin-13 isoform X2 [Sardina pilchardus]|uniref:synaptotagmin-13 isoform X2 n=1 Tax=Sardina pilchardus TaxID=27697 RepID=UPI002E0EF86D